MPKPLLWRGLLLMAAAVLAASLVQAQEGPAGRWWHNPGIARELRLTPGEIQSLEKAFSQTRMKMIELKSRVETEQVQLQQLLERPNLDERAVRHQNSKLEQARTELANERTNFIVQVRKIIGPERFQQLVQLGRR